MLRISRKNPGEVPAFARFVKYASLLIGVGACINVPIYTFVFRDPGLAWVPWALSAIAIIAVFTAVLAHQGHVAGGAILISITIACVAILPVEPDDVLSRTNGAILIIPITIMGFVFGMRIAFALSGIVISSILLLPVFIPGAEWTKYTISNVSLICTSVGLLWMIHHLFGRLRLVNEQLEQVNEREQRIRMFMYFFQHELKSYASGLKILMKLAESSFSPLKTDEQSIQLLMLINGNIDKLNKLAHNLVLLSREGVLPHQWQRMEITTLLSQAKSDFLATHYNYPITLTVDAQDNAVVLIEPTYVLLAIGTAVRNAIEALAQREKGQEFRIMISAERQEHRVLIRIEDTGPGFPDTILAALEQAMQPETPPMLFGWSTKPTGVGLGLVLIVHVARLHGGQAQFHNTETGASVAFDLPLASGETVRGDLETAITSY